MGQQVQTNIKQKTCDPLKIKGVLSIVILDSVNPWSSRPEPAYIGVHDSHIYNTMYDASQSVL